MSDVDANILISNTSTAHATVIPEQKWAVFISTYEYIRTVHHYTDEYSLY